MRVYTIAAVPVRAFLFDFDGLILDTESPSRAGWQWLYREHGHELPPEKWALMVGTVEGWDIWGHLEELVGGPLDREMWNDRRYEHELSLLEAEEVRPGIADYLRFASEHGLKRAIVSSASRRWIDMHLERLERTFGWDAIVSRRSASRPRRRSPSRTRRTVRPRRRRPASTSSASRTPSPPTSASPATSTCCSPRSPTYRRTPSCGRLA
jgi:phosphoglycolate phosphatase-like HAD superfamily hydrolase